MFANKGENGVGAERTFMFRNTCVSLPLSPNRA